MMSFLTYITGFLIKFGCGGHLGRSSEMPDTIWKRTTQESFQQSLVEIGSVVSEEKIFFKFHPPFFLI
jgi:UV DNA damage repair endonuclease